MGLHCIQAYLFIHREREKSEREEREAYFIYTALQEGGQVELPRHTDAGDISFMIALSGSKDYEGANILKSTIYTAFL